MQFLLFELDLTLKIKVYYHQPNPPRAISHMVGILLQYEGKHRIVCVRCAIYVNFIGNLRHTQLRK